MPELTTPTSTGRGLRGALSVIWGSTLRRVVKSAFGVVLIGVGTRAIYVSYVATYSSVAVVTGMRTMIRAPVRGIVRYGFREIGQSVDKGDGLATITDELIDDSLLQDLKARLAATDVERDSALTFQAKLEGIREQLASGVSKYEAGRLKTLAAQLVEAKARAETERLKLEQAEAQQRRAEALANDQLISAQELEAIRRDRAVSSQATLQSEASVAALMTNLESSGRGINLDTMTDRPYSRQRLDEVDIRLAELSTSVARLSRQSEVLAQQLAAETGRIERARESNLTAPFDGQIWAALTASGEYVEHGTGLFELVDCSRPLVLAWVTERNFRRIHMGLEATVEISGPNEHYPATVVQLVGYLDQLPNVVLRGSHPALSESDASDQYAVILSVPELAKGSNGCEFGRTVEVRFHADIFSS